MIWHKNNKPNYGRLSHLLLYLYEMGNGLYMKILNFYFCTINALNLKRNGTQSNKNLEVQNDQKVQ